MADSGGFGGLLRSLLGISEPQSGGRDSSIPSQAQDPGSLVAPEFSMGQNLMPAHLMSQQEANRNALIDAFGQDYLDFEAQGQQTALDTFNFVAQAPITDALVVMSRAFLDAEGTNKDAAAAAFAEGRDYLIDNGLNYLLPWLERPEMRSFQEEVPEIGERAAVWADLLSGLVGVTDVVGDATRAARVLGSPALGRAFGDVFDEALGIVVTERSVRNDPALRAALEVRKATAPGGVRGFWEDMRSMSGAHTSWDSATVNSGPAHLALGASDDLKGVHVGTLTTAGDVEEASAMRGLMPVLHNADVNGVRMDTTPASFGSHRMTTPQLRTTYNRVGFELTPSDSMVRYPLPTDPAEAAIEQAARQERHDRVVNALADLGFVEPFGLAPTARYRNLLDQFFPDLNTSDFGYQVRMDAMPSPDGGWDLFLILPEGERIPYMPQRANGFSVAADFENANQAFQVATGGKVDGLGEFAERALAAQPPGPVDPTAVVNLAVAEMEEALRAAGLPDPDSLVAGARDAIARALNRNLTDFTPVPLTTRGRPSALEALAQKPDSWVSQMSPEDRALLRRTAVALHGGTSADDDAALWVIERAINQGDPRHMEGLRDAFAEAGLTGAEAEGLVRRLQRTFGVEPAAPGGMASLGPVPNLTSAEEQVVMNVLNQNTSRMFADLTDSGPAGIDRNQTIARLIEVRDSGGQDAVSRLVQQQYGYDAGHADLVAYMVEGVARELDNSLGARGVSAP